MTGKEFGNLTREDIRITEQGYKIPDAVKESIVRALPAASVDETRSILVSVLWGRQGEQHIIAATDTYRLHVEDLTIPDSKANPDNMPADGTYWLIPADALRSVLGTITGRGPDTYMAFLPPDPETATLEVDVANCKRTEEVPGDLIIGVEKRSGGRGRFKTRTAACLQIVGQFPNIAKMLEDFEPTWEGEFAVEEFAEKLEALEGPADYEAGQHGGAVKVVGNGRIDLRAGKPGLYGTAHLPAEKIDGDKDEEAAWFAHKYLTDWADRTVEVSNDYRGATVALCGPLAPALFCYGPGRHLLMPRAFGRCEEEFRGAKA